MKFTYGSLVVETHSSKRVIKSRASGATNAGEIRWLTSQLVSAAAAWMASGWAYIVDISNSAPLTPDVNKEMVNLHKQLAAAGCKAMAFVVGIPPVLAAQAEEQPKQSHASIKEECFETEAEALKWIDTIL